MSTSKDKGPSDRCQLLMRQILQYLTDHPDAKDTADGILKWWLPSHPIEWEKKEVQQVLDHFVLRGWLRKRNIYPSRDLYSLNKKRLKKIKDFLQTLGGGKDT